VISVGCNILSENAVWAGVAVACVLLASIYSIGNVSGANFNPAVSLALGLLETMGGNGMSWEQVCVYACVQALGGMAAGICYTSLFQTGFALAPSKNFTLIEAGICEVLYTFMLCFVVLNVTAAKKRGTNDFFGLAIGLVIVAGSYSGGAVSGGCYNPAVAAGVDISFQFSGWCAVYAGFEFLGAVLAVFFFRLVRPEEFTDEPWERGFLSKLISEFLGTFLLVVTVGLNTLAVSKAGAFSNAACLTCMIYALADVSGAHFNPAVTVAVWASGCCREVTVSTAFAYVVTQLVAGMCGGTMYLLIYWDQSNSSFALGPPDRALSLKWPAVAVAEVVFTFMLCYVVLCVTLCKRTKSQDMLGLIIGSCVTVGGFAIGSISGGSLNPAVSFGVSFAHMLDGGGKFLHALVYTAFEMFAGALAACVLQVTHALDMPSKCATP